MASLLRGLASITSITSRNGSPNARTTVLRWAKAPSTAHHSYPASPQTPLSRSLFPSRRAFHTSRLLQSTTTTTTPKFTYGIAASFSAKDQRYNPRTNIFAFNPYNRILAQRPDKRTRPASGQDAFFVSRLGSSPNSVALGIADGVGGWADTGVDPADFAHGFCDYMAHAAYTDGDGALGARALMQRGYEDIRADASVPAGGSTACVAIARGSGALEVANLGDSGFVQLRLNAVHASSEAQTHAFNTPYQLSVIPKKTRAQARAFGGMQLCDLPRDAHVSLHELRHGDVLVFASDGVWDNLSRSDILKVVSRIMVQTEAWRYTEKGIRVGSDLHGLVFADDEKSGSEIPSLQSFLAVGVTSEAKKASVNSKLDGPFAREVQREYPHENWHGGKVDDICVVVAVVCEEGK